MGDLTVVITVYHSCGKLKVTHINMPWMISLVHNMAKFHLMITTVWI